MTSKVRLRVPVQRAILRSLAVVSLIGCVLGLATVAAVDWIMFRFHSDVLATDETAAAQAFTSEAWMMIILNIGVVVAVGMNLLGVWFMLRGRRKRNPPTERKPV